MDTQGALKVKDIKLEARDRFTVQRYKAMPAYCVLFFVIVNVLVFAGVLFAVVSALGLHPAVSWVFFGYGWLLILVVVFLSGPFSYSMVDYYMRAYSGKDTDEAFRFDGFGKANFGRTVLTNMLRSALLLLFTCLLIVPGIIFGIKTSMAFHLMRANPKMKFAGALKASSKVMKGHSFFYFKLCFSFIGWFFLSILTLGAGFIYMLPYFNTCKSIFYKRVVQGGGAAYSSVRERKEEEEQIAAPVQNEQTEESIDEPAAVYEQSEPITPAPEPIADYFEPVVASDEQSEVSPEPYSAESEPPVIMPEPEQALAENEPPVIMPEPEAAEPIATAEPMEEPMAAEPITVKEPSKADLAKEAARAKKQAEEEERAKKLAENLAAKEAIKKRIEQLKREKGAHGARPDKPRPAKPSHPEPKKPEPVVSTPEPEAEPIILTPEPEPVISSIEPEPIVPIPEPEPIAAEPEPKTVVQPKKEETARPKKNDEFAPEIIDVEIVEE